MAVPGTGALAHCSATWPFVIIDSGKGLVPNKTKNPVLTVNYTIMITPWSNYNKKWAFSLGANNSNSYLACQFHQG